MKTSHSIHSLERCVVTTFSSEGELLHSQVWENAYPLGLDYPFSWIVERIPNGIRVRDLKMSRVEIFPFSRVETQEPLVFGQLRMKIHPLDKPNQELAWRPSFVYPQAASYPDETGRFRKLLKYSSFTLLFFLGIAISVPLPRPSKDELIPPQFAKLLMKPSSPGFHSSQNSPSEASSSKAQATAVVHAFQTRQVQHSVHQLFKGGLLALLKNSPLANGSKSRAAMESLFKSQMNANSLAPSSNLLEARSIQVSQLGGSGAGTGVGYSKGSHSTVSGQGSSQVSLETEDARVDEGLTKEEVGKVIHAHISEVRYCYESAILRNPMIQGKLMVEFSIHGKPAVAGTVKQARVSSSSLEDAAVGDCIVKKLVGWRFPKPRGNVDVSVNYPFIFKTLGR